MAEDYYSILGIPHTATPAEIKKAYLKLARECHPDRVSDPEKRSQAEVRFQLINESYNNLRDQKLRAEYDRSLQRQSMTPKEEAALYYKNGQMREEMSDYDTALKLYFEARRLEPTNATYTLAAANLLARDRSKQRQAIELYNEVIEKNPRQADPYLQMGELFSRSGMMLRARRIYQTGLQNVPGHPELQRRLRAIDSAERGSRNR